MRIFADKRGRSVGYLGPPGTFTHRSVQVDPVLAALRQVPCANAGEVVDRVARGAVTFGVLAWENSVAGIVGPTADLLAGVGGPTAGDPVSTGRVRLCRDVVLPVRFQLVGRPGIRPGRLRAVCSHPHALAQCARWLAANAPAASHVPTASTAAAMERAGDDDETAAVAPAGLPPPPGLVPLAVGIGERNDAETRFVVLRRGLPARTGRDRTVVACFQNRDRPGSLMSVLEPFAWCGVDLLRIESRPTRERLGRFYFILECRSHPDEQPLREVMAALRARSVRVRVLGTLGEPVGAPPAPRLEPVLARSAR